MVTWVTSCKVYVERYDRYETRQRCEDCYDVEAVAAREWRKAALDIY
jgi:hypothetical protein